MPVTSHLTRVRITPLPEVIRLLSCLGVIAGGAKSVTCEIKPGTLEALFAVATIAVKDLCAPPGNGCQQKFITSHANLSLEPSPICADGKCDLGSAFRPFARSVLLTLGRLSRERQ